MAQQLAIVDDNGCVIPLAAGAVGTYLTTDVSGNVVWSTVTSGGGTITDVTVVDGTLTVTYADGTTQTYTVLQYC